MGWIRRISSRPPARGAGCRDRSRPGSRSRALAHRHPWLRCCIGFPPWQVDPHALYREWNFTPPPNPLRTRAGTLARSCRRPDQPPGRGACAGSATLPRALRAELLAQQARLGAGDWPFKVAAGPTLRLARARASCAHALPPWARPCSRRDKTTATMPWSRRSKRFQAAHGLQADVRVLGAQTLEALNASPAAAWLRSAPTSSACAGWRATCRATACWWTSSATADLVLDGQPVWSSRVIVGKPKAAPPAARQRHPSGAQPKWVVPPTILREDVIPGAARNPSYLATTACAWSIAAGRRWTRHHRLERGAPERFPHRVEQQSGADGSLRADQFSLSNPYVIYLRYQRALLFKPPGVRSARAACAWKCRPSWRCTCSPTRCDKFRRCRRRSTAGARVRSMSARRQGPAALRHRGARQTGRGAAAQRHLRLRRGDRRRARCPGRLTLSLVSFRYASP